MNIGRHIGRRRPPRNLNEADRYIFAHELEKAIPETEILEMQDVLVSPEGLILKRGRIHDISFALSPGCQKWKARSVAKALLLNYVVRSSVQASASGVWVTDTWSSGYFHWICDSLPRILAVRNRLEQCKLYLPAGFANISYVNESLSCLGIKNVEFVPRDKVIRFSRLYVPTHTAVSGDFNVRLIESLRQAFRNSISGDSSRRSLYVSRARALKRRVANEAEVLKVIGDFGFETIKAEDFSFVDQIKQFAGVDFLIANHGAGMTNMLFMASGNRVLELRHKADATNNCYFNMASALDLDYYYQLCEPHSTGDDPHIADLVVDIDSLRLNVELMLLNQ